MLLNADAAILVCWDESLAHDAGYGPVDCSAATQNMLLAAYELGLGAVWVGIYPRPNRINEMKKIFDLPAHIHGFSIVSIGYPAEKRNVPERYNLSRIHYEKW
jgi:nitroreductase